MTLHHQKVGATPYNLKCAQGAQVHTCTPDTNHIVQPYTRVTQTPCASEAPTRAQASTPAPAPTHRPLSVATGGARFAWCPCRSRATL